jgi:hypothetical protein
LAQGPVTQLLRARAAGDASADRLVVVIYDELPRLAERKTRGGRCGHTSIPTSLIHHAWLRLGADDAQATQDRGRLHIVAPILVDGFEGP